MKPGCVLSFAGSMIGNMFDDQKVEDVAVMMIRRNERSKDRSSSGSA